MKSILLAGALALASCQPALAQDLHPMTDPTDQTQFTDCGPMDTLMPGMRDKGFQIQMVLNNEHMPNYGGQTILAANTETGQWALLAIAPQFENLVCVIQEGMGYEPGSLVFVPSPVGEDG